MNTTDYEQRCIHEIFEEQVARNPTRVALSSAGREVSYGELNAQANRLAANLRKRGAGPDGPGALVGLCLDLSLDAVSSVLAILKTGAAYVPLSPQEPFRRIEEIVKDTGLSAVVTRLGLRHRISDSDVDVLCIDEEFRLLARESPENLNVPMTADRLAYVSYTSGSTGRPKGVLSTHRSAINGIAAPPFDPDGDEVCALSTPLRFGFSVSAMFLPLMLGKRLAIFPERAIGDPERFVDILETEGVTYAVLVPALLREILRLNTPLKARLSRIRTLVVSGSTLSPELASEVVRVMPHVRLLNGYASSEIGGAAILWDESDRRNVDAAGRPFPNTRVYVLDERMQPATPGTIGEIYVGAAHLAQGYLGQPALTAERFLPDPFGGVAGERMYRTGDLGRRTADGRVAVLGRVDDQIKIRGFRVELGEIEAILRSHPGVLDVAVTADSTAPDDVWLTAYAVVRKTAPPTATDLRHFVADRLPEYVNPAAYVVLDKPLPRTPLGKLDKENLPKRESQDLSDRVSPKTSVEIAIAEVWQDLFGIESVSLHDNFLELGGHSLLAAQAIARLRKLFGVPLSPRDFLDHPTIAEQAREIERSRAFAGLTSGHT